MKAANLSDATTMPFDPLRPEVVEVTGRDELALVYLLRLGPRPQQLVETVDAIDPRYSRQDKAVIIVSTQFGCPVGCVMCDAAGGYYGNLDAEQILSQVRLVLRRRPELLASAKLKVQLARMGEPALNARAVLQALRRLPEVAPAAGLLPCIATVAPAGSDVFLEELLQIRREVYGARPFQLQISLNTTDRALRRRLIPIRLLDEEALARYGERFSAAGPRKVVLNFALARSFPLDVAWLRSTFDPAAFIVKLTPVNPTDHARQADLQTVLSAAAPAAAADLVEALERAGYETIVSIGEPDEIAIGSNCGQAVLRRSRR